MFSASKIGIAAISNGITTGPQLLERLVCMSELVDAKIEQIGQTAPSTGLRCFLDSFYMAKGGDGTSYLALQLTECVDVNTGEYIPPTAYSVANDFLAVIEQALQIININYELYNNALRVAFSEAITGYNLSTESLSITASFKNKFIKQREILTQHQQKNFYKFSYVLMRDIYQDNNKEIKFSNEIKQKIKLRGRLVPVDIEAQFQQASSHHEPSVRFDNFRQLVKFQKVIHPNPGEIAASHFHLEINKQVQILEKFIQQKEPQWQSKALAELKNIAAEIQFSNDPITQQQCHNLSTLAEYFDKAGERLSSKASQSRDSYDAITAGVTMLLLGENIRNLLEPMYISSYADSIGLDNNLLRRIDELAETDILSAAEKTLYLKYIIYSTMENWIDPRQRYEGDKRPIYPHRQSVVLQSFYRDLKLLKEMCAMLGAVEVETPDSTTEVIKLLVKEVSLERCTRILKEKYHAVIRQGITSDEYAEVEQKYQQALEVFEAQPITPTSIGQKTQESDDEDMGSVPLRKLTITAEEYAQEHASLVTSGGFARGEFADSAGSAKESKSDYLDRSGQGSNIRTRSGLSAFDPRELYTVFH